MSAVVRSLSFDLFSRAYADLLRDSWSIALEYEKSEQTISNRISPLSKKGESAIRTISYLVLTLSLFQAEPTELLTSPHPRLDFPSQPLLPT